jgi:hypothetical protein
VTAPVEVSAGNAAQQVWASYSQLASHRKCPQAWFYGYERRLEKVDPEDIAVERDFGSWWHMLLAADSIDRGTKLGSLKWVPEELGSVDTAPRIKAKTAKPGEVFALARDWWRGQTPLTQETWTARLGESLPERMDALYLRWYEQWWDSAIRYESPLAVELKWRRELPSLPGPNGDTHPNAILVGYVDEAYIDTTRHLTVVRDHKVSRGLGIQTVADDMMDSQLQFYAWGASPTVTSWGVGPIQATGYDRARMVKAKTPQVTQAGSLSKSITDFDVRTYVEWAKGPDGNGVPYPGRAKDGSGAGLYKAEPALIEQLSRPAATSGWFQRSTTPLNRNLIRAHLRAAVDSAADLALSRARVEVEHEAARNLTSGCKWCDYVKLCRAEMIGGPDGEYDLTDMNLRVKPKRS